ncbi:hypothetical protein QA635_32805 [Bradyrhizobium brasilense]|uniref:hypothetical protein n=1 Tax=Bradyrhizobium brasilense TaxID=1419277 RepID=UPI0024B1B5AD|nr:hypothetical protein [Bradyrhizobium australafricanum]WFU31304.1 hypothetical protein QA635_32805 [Bradyrhizobium australafricanum]
MNWRRGMLSDFAEGVTVSKLALVKTVGPGSGRHEIHATQSRALPPQRCSTMVPPTAPPCGFPPGIFLYLRPGIMQQGMRRLQPVIAHAIPSAFTSAQQSGPVDVPDFPGLVRKRRGG